jgi:hypothetical protein
VKFCARIAQLSPEDRRSLHQQLKSVFTNEMWKNVKKLFLTTTLRNLSAMVRRQPLARSQFIVDSATTHLTLLSYAQVIFKEDVAVSAALLTLVKPRAHLIESIAIHIVATGEQYRDHGLCRALMSEVENLLQSKPGTGVLQLEAVRSAPGGFGTTKFWRDHFEFTDLAVNQDLPSNFKDTAWLHKTKITAKKDIRTVWDKVRRPT